MQAHTLWFLRKDGVIKGPFPTAVISQYLLLGRIDKHDEVSVDQHTWHQIADVDELIPEVIKADLTVPQKKDNLEIATRQADERLEERRRRIHKLLAPDDERRTQERRKHESDSVIDYREMKVSRKNRRWRERSVNKFLAFAIIFSVVSALVYWSIQYTPEETGPDMDCAAPPGVGINWSNCDMQGVVLDGMDLHQTLMRSANLTGTSMHNTILRETDLAYSNMSLSRLSGADMRNAILTGANLKGSDMSNSDLRGADLSFANLWGANLSGAKLEGAKLDQAVWVNRETCDYGSVGQCLVSR